MKLRAHLGEKPRTKPGQVRQAWPDIKQLLDAGHSLKDVCKAVRRPWREAGVVDSSDSSLLEHDQAIQAALTAQMCGRTGTPVLEVLFRLRLRPTELA